MFPRCVLAVSLALAACASPVIGAADVTLLVPLEGTTDLPGAAETLGRRTFDRLPPLTVVDEPDDLFHALRIVGVRLDPCFRDVLDEPCTPSLRLVLQPVLERAEGRSTRDAAVHAFFRVSASEVEQLATTLAAERTRRGLPSDEREALREPALRRQLFHALRQLATPERLSRVAAVSLHPSNEAWTFTAFDVDGPRVAPRLVPTLAVAEAKVTSLSTARSVTLLPGSTAEPALAQALAKNALSGAPEPLLRSTADAIERVIDPARHGVGTVDCVTCHLAPVARRALLSTSAAPPTRVEAPDVYDDPRNLRAFGYLGAVPSISPRVQLETAAVVQSFAASSETP